MHQMMGVKQKANMNTEFQHNPEIGSTQYLRNLDQRVSMIFNDDLRENH